MTRTLRALGIIIEGGSCHHFGARLRYFACAEVLSVMLLGMELLFLEIMERLRDLCRNRYRYRGLSRSPVCRYPVSSEVSLEFGGT